MDLFHVIEEGNAILRTKGVFRQVKVYRRGDKVYAAWGSGFIRLTAGGGTINPNIACEGVDAPGVFVKGTGAPVFTA